MKLELRPSATDPRTPTGRGSRAQGVSVVTVWVWMEISDGDYRRENRKQYRAREIDFNKTQKEKMYL